VARGPRGHEGAGVKGRTGTLRAGVHLRHLLTDRGLLGKPCEFA
jgi:hypothetical protein